MREILCRDIEDAAKAKLYLDILSRYLKFDKPVIVTKFTAKDIEEIFVSDTLDAVMKELDSVACRGCWMPGANGVLGCLRKYFVFLSQNV